MSERKMATIRRIDSIEPIEGADLIEAIKIGGWTVVAQKEMNYKINSLIVFCEIDAFIPTPIAPFLTQPGKYPKEFNGVQGERLRTKKLKGIVSQGLILPLSVLDIKTDSGNYSGDWECFEGFDVSEKLNIQKWEPPAEFQHADAKGLFPYFIPKTDQERVQNIKKKYNEWYVESLSWEVTEKLHGSSMTVYFKDGEVGVCSRNLELKEDLNNTFWKTAHSSGAVEALKSLGKNIAVQGELVGPGINDNIYKLTEFKFYVFDIFDIDEQEYLTPSHRYNVVKTLQLLHVPVLYSAELQQDSVDDLLLYAEGKSELNITTEREGLVFKKVTSNDSFKVVSNRWLMKHE
jgi:RNA ligase (TIGR02306 family)